MNKQSFFILSSLRKIRENSQPLGYLRTKPVEKTNIGPYLDRIKGLLKSDKQEHKKQYYTAKKILEILQSEGFTGGCRHDIPDCSVPI